MAKFIRKTLLTAAEETIVGVEEVDNFQAVLINSGSTINPTADFKTRDIYTKTFSALGGISSNRKWEFNLPIELKGGGVGELPEIAPLLMACSMKKNSLTIAKVSSTSGFTRGAIVKIDGNDAGILVDIIGSSLYIVGDVTASLGVSVTQDLASTTLSSATVSGNMFSPTSTWTEQKSATLKWYMDGIVHTAVGARGSFQLDCTAGEFGIITFSMTGAYHDNPVDETNPDATFNETIPSICESAGLQIDDVDMDKTAVSKLTVDLGNTISDRQDINSEGAIKSIEITGRTVTGSVDPEVISLSDYDLWTKWRNGTTFPIHAKFGKNAGEFVEISLPYAQYQNPSYADRNGIANYNLPFTATGGQIGDDEFYMYFY